MAVHEPVHTCQFSAKTSLPAEPAARRRGGSIVTGILTGVSVIAVMGIAILVIGVVIDDRAGDRIEDERTRIRLVLEVEHVIERIRMPVDGSPTCGRSKP